SLDFFDQLITHLKYLICRERRRFLDEIDSAGIQCIEDELAGLVCDTHDHNRYRTLCHLLADETQPAGARHDQVQRDNVRTQLIHEGQRLFRASGNSNNIDEWTSPKHLFDHLANIGRIVNHQCAQNSLHGVLLSFFHIHECAADFIQIQIDIEFQQRFCGRHEQVSGAAHIPFKSLYYLEDRRVREVDEYIPAEDHRYAGKLVYGRLICKIYVVPLHKGVQIWFCFPSIFGSFEEPVAIFQRERAKTSLTVNSRFCCP